MDTDLREDDAKSGDKGYRPSRMNLEPEIKPTLERLATLTLRRHTKQSHVRGSGAKTQK